MQIENYGRLRKLALPADWVESERTAEPLSGQEMRCFHRCGDETLQLRLVYRGRPQSQAVADAFADLLVAQPHELSGLELQAVLPLLGIIGDTRWFAVTSARTENVNGRRVLAVSGDYKADPYTQTTIFVDADQSGAYVQEISFLSPRAGETVQSRLFDDLLTSLEWID